jgi:hypothetical protein
MRRPLLAVLSVILISASVRLLWLAAAAARYCHRSDHWVYPDSWQFSTRYQRRASVSGTSSYCGINPHYEFARWQAPTAALVFQRSFQ